MSHGVADLRPAHTSAARRVEQITHTTRITHVNCLGRRLWTRPGGYGTRHRCDAGTARRQALRTRLLLVADRVAAPLLFFELPAVTLQGLVFVAGLQHMAPYSATGNPHAKPCLELHHTTEDIAGMLKRLLVGPFGLSKGSTYGVHVDKNNYGPSVAIGVGCTSHVTPLGKTGRHP